MTAAIIGFALLAVVIGFCLFLAAGGWIAKRAERRAQFKISVQVDRFYDMPAFGAYLAKELDADDTQPLILLNVDAIMHEVLEGRAEPREVAQIIADTITHEVLHAVEEWAGCDFNEEWVEKCVEAARSGVDGVRSLRPPAGDKSPAGVSPPTPEGVET